MVRILRFRPRADCAERFSSMVTCARQKIWTFYVELSAENWPRLQAALRPLNAGVPPFEDLPKDSRLPGAGTLLTRRLGDRQIVVKVLSDGFEYESRHYRSLSAIAREVTGTRWNGLLFFGLAERRDA